MKNNIIIIICTSLILGVFYFFYNNQTAQLKDINNSILEIEKKLLTITGSENPVLTDDYKENNLISNNTINFADSLTKLMDMKINTEIPDTLYIDIENEVEDTLCYGLENQYKIISFYNERIRIKNISKPGSKLMSKGDTLYYDNLKYLILAIDSKAQHIYLYNLTDKKNCYFFKD